MGTKEAIKCALQEIGISVSDTDTLRNYAEKIGCHNSVLNLYDYDGTLIASYESGEISSLTSLPDAPSHKGLIFQGWNYSLEDAKAYVMEYGKLDIGATYITDDGKTRLYISIVGERATTVPLYFNQTVSNGVTIEWGDGISSTISGTGNVNTSHTYSSTGDYVISLSVTSGTLSLGGIALYCVMGGSDDIYSNMLTSVNIGSVTTIGDSAFYGCNSLTNVTIPNSVTTIGDSAFYFCHSLTNVTIPNSVTSISRYTFYGCGSLTNVTIPNSVTTIGYSAFYDCGSLTNVTIPNSVTTIGDIAFYFCHSLTNVTIPNSVTTIGRNAFTYCNSLTNVTIPNSVTTIDNSAFAYCNSLTNVTIPNSVTMIGANIFSYCNSLTNVTIPNSATSISRYTFYGCRSLTNVTIPNSVTTIDDSAFRNCTGIQLYDFSQHTSVPTLSNTNAFEGINANCAIKVPALLYGEWIAATNWSTYASYIVAPDLISFTINNKQFYAKKGMIWLEWVNSPYNTDGFIINKNYVCRGNYRIRGVSKTNIISPDYSYILERNA